MKSANDYQAHHDEGNDTFSSCVALDDVTVFEAAELDVIALLADTWNDDLHAEVSAQLVQASAQAYVFLSERTKEKVKAKQKVRARADILFDRHICHWRTVDDWKNRRQRKNVVLVVGALSAAMSPP